MSAPDIWPFHGRAFLGDTEKFSAAETGAYIRLLIFYWHNRGLPTADDELRNISGLPAPAWKRSRAKIKSKFKPGWRHERADRDLAFVAKQRATQRANANRRWHPVHNADNFMSCNSSHGMGPQQQHQTLNSDATHAVAMPKEVKQFKPVSISGVYKSGQPRQAEPLPKHKPSKQHRAEQAWGNDLRHSYSAEEYARAIDLLAADPDLVAEATRAELKQPGSGHVVAMLGLSVREVGA